MSTEDLYQRVMAEEVCAINSSIAIDYLETYHPEVSVDGLIAEIQNKNHFNVINQQTTQIEEITREHLSNAHYWVSNKFFAAFYEVIEAHVDDSLVAYKIGRHSVRSKKGLKYNMGAPIVGLEQLLERIPEEMQRWNRTKEVEILETEKKNSFKIKLTHKPHVIVSQFALDYHRGIFDAFGELCGLNGFMTTINEDESDPEHNVYVFEASYTNYNPIERIRNKRLMSNPAVQETLDNMREVAMSELHENQRMRDALSELVGQLEKEKRISERLQHFVSPEILDVCVVQDKDPELATKPEYKTISFCDIRDFTTKTEELGNQLAVFLKHYFNAIVPSIAQHQGEVDKYIGDAIMALFNSSYDSILAAIDMREALRSFNDQFKNRNTSYASVFPINNGIGIASGVVDIGNVGTEDRMERTVIGDTVNLASRLEGLTKEYHIGIITDHATYTDVYEANHIAPLYQNKSRSLSTFEAYITEMLHSGNIFMREIGKVQVKGREKPERIFEVMNHDSRFVLMLKNKLQPRHEEALSLFYGEGLSSEPSVHEQQKMLLDAKRLFSENARLFSGGFQKLLEHANQHEQKFIGTDLEDRISRKFIEDATSVLRDMKANPDHYEAHPWNGVVSFDHK